MGAGLVDTCQSMNGISIGGTCTCSPTCTITGEAPIATGLGLAADGSVLVVALLENFNQTFTVTPNTTNLVVTSACTCDVASTPSQDLSAATRLYFAHVDVGATPDVRASASLPVPPDTRDIQVSANGGLDQILLLGESLATGARRVVIDPSQLP